MKNRLLHHLAYRLGVNQPTALWLLTVLTVLPIDRFPLEEWNEALSIAAGRRIFCPSYKRLASYLQNMVFDVK